MLVMLENVIEQLLRTSIVFSPSFAVVSLPQHIFLAESRLDLPLRKRLMDDGLTTPAIAAMLAHVLAQELLNYWIELSIVGQLKARVGEVSSLQAPVERARVIALRRRHLSVHELVLQESLVVESLISAFVCQVSINPEELAVTVELRPVVIPVFGTVFGFADVVWAVLAQTSSLRLRSTRTIAFTVATHIDNFEGDFGRSKPIQILDKIMQSLPLHQFISGEVVLVIFPVKQAKIVLCLFNHQHLNSNPPICLHHT